MVTKSSIVEQYPKVFKGIGRLKNTQIKLHIDKDITPVVQPCRRIPLAMRQKVKDELDRLERADIIEKVYGPTEWVSPIVLQTKKDSSEIRLCVDMRLANKAIKRTHHVLPTIEEVRHKLNGAKWFSKIDLKNAYHQLELHPDSRDITTFATHEGLRRYKTVNYGTCSGTEIFHEEIRKNIADIIGVINIYDDILAYGKTKREHDRAVHGLLKRLEAIGITANVEKCVFNRNEIEFFGMIFSENGMGPDPKKVEVLKNAEAPSNPDELKSFLGMSNYSGRFIENYSKKRRCP